MGGTPAAPSLYPAAPRSTPASWRCFNARARTDGSPTRPSMGTVRPAAPSITTAYRRRCRRRWIPQRTSPRAYGLRLESLVTVNRPVHVRETTSRAPSARPPHARQPSSPLMRTRARSLEPWPRASERKRSPASRPPGASGSRSPARGDRHEVITDRLEVVRHLLDARGRNGEPGEVVHSTLDVGARVTYLSDSAPFPTQTHPHATSRTARPKQRRRRARNCTRTLVDRPKSRRQA